MRELIEEYLELLPEAIAAFFAIVVVRLLITFGSDVYSILFNVL